MRRRSSSAGRGGLVEAAVLALQLADFEASESGGRCTGWREAADRAVSELSTDEAAWVFDLRAGRITEEGPLVRQIERRFGAYERCGL